MHPQVDELLQHAYHPHPRLPDLLQALLHALTALKPFSRGSLRLRAAGLEVSAGAAVPHPVSSLTLPITYAGEPLGELRGEWPNEMPRPTAGLCEDFALRCAYLVKRYEVQAWAQRRLGQPLLLVGFSDALHRLEVFVEKAAHSMLPVLLKGEFGTEKALLAATLHGCGPHRDGPFVEVHCADPVDQPAQWFEQARGGTLFLNGIEDLAHPLQTQLPQFMPSRLGQWLAVPDAHETRVIASATADLRQCVERGRFSRQLLAELDFLAMTVPPLRERPGDIPSLLVAALERHHCDARQACTQALTELCPAMPGPRTCSRWSAWWPGSRS